MTVAGIPICFALLLGMVGVTYTGKEGIILSKDKTQTLEERNRPAHFGTGIGEVVEDAEDQHQITDRIVLVRIGEKRHGGFEADTVSGMGVEGDCPADRWRFFFSRHR